MKTNLTLTIDEDVLREARKLALDRKTSVNQMVREYLEGLVKTPTSTERSIARMEEIWRTSKAEVGPITWTRDDIYER